MSTHDKAPHLEVTLVLHGGLGAGPSPTGRAVTVVPGTTLAEALAPLGVEPGLVGVASSAGRLVKPEDVLECDCVVDVYPVFGGG